MNNSTENATKRNPNVWVPTLYYTQGFPLTVVTEMSQVFFKALNVPLEALGIFSAIFNLPWAFKFLWSPLVDLFGAKRRWILVMQTLLVGAFGLLTVLALMRAGGATLSLKIFMMNPASMWTPLLILLFLFAVAFSLDVRRAAAVRGAFMLVAAAVVGYTVWKHTSMFMSTAITVPAHVWALAGCFLGIAFLSATHDIAIDGYYLDVLDKDGQAAYSGIRIAAYRVAMVVGSGVLVMVAGKTSWGLGFGAGAALFVLFLMFHLWYLPASKSAAAQSGQAQEGDKKSFVAAFTSYLDQKRIAFILLFIVLFRIGDLLWKPMSKPFLMDLGVSVTQIGFLQGVLGIIATILGSIAGGIYIARRGLARGLWVLGIIQSITLLLYAYLALVHPIIGQNAAISRMGLIHVGVINVFENFAYGLGTIAFVNFLMRTCKKEYTAAHYAIATSLMALSGTIAGFFSGFVAKEIGYLHFFVICFLCSIPGLVLLLFLPLKEMEAAK